MAKKYKAKNRTKKIIAIIVAVVLGIALIAGIVALTRPNTKDERIEINPKFTTGALSATTGKYTETEASLYTKEVFDATGLQVEVDFDATVSYQLFYYDEDGAFLAASAVLTENHTAVLPEGTDGARMVITPDWTDVDEDEQVIAWYDVNKYVDQLKLTITNPDYVEEETEDEDNEDKADDGIITVADLEIDKEHWGKRASFYSPSGTPEFVEASSEEGAFWAPFKPIAMEAGDYYVCFDTVAITNNNITGLNSSVCSIVYKNEDGTYAGYEKLDVGAFTLDELSVDGYGEVMSINIPVDTDTVYIACEVCVMNNFAIIKV